MPATAAGPAAGVVPAGSTYYAVLVGIDDYASVPKLSGCVNDVEAIEELLTARVQGQLLIRKLVARRSQGAESASDDELPTRDALIAVLSALSGDALHPGDRVLFYYSGHGAQLYDPRAEDTRQGLVPQDFRAGAGLLFDIELRTLLDQIYARTGDLTVVLDCCNSAGVTRELDILGAGCAQIRSIELRETDVAVIGTPSPELVGVQGDPAGLARPREPVFLESVPYPILLACQADEKARESPFSEPPQGQHGVLTHALVRTLSREPAERLKELCWADIWWPLRAELISQSAQQHPHLLGPREQCILGGGSPRYAVGLPLRQLADGRYELGVGTLAGMQPGARIAVYEQAPAALPALGSEAERGLARAGELIVVDAALATATAIPDPPSAVFPLLPGMCARVTQPGAIEPLATTLGSDLPADLVEALHAAAVDDHVRYVDTRGEARIGVSADGGLWLGDDVYGPGPLLEPGAPGPLAYIPPISDLRAKCAAVRAALCHYRSYGLPLRMARQGGYTFAPGRLQVQFLACADAEAFQALREDAEKRQPVRRNARGIAQLAPGEGFALAVRNLLPTPLYVTLLACNGSGKVALLASSEFVAGKSTTVIGRSSQSGTYGPLFVRLPAGHSWLIDRIIAVGADQPLVDLYTLRLGRSFAEVVTQALREGLSRGKDFDEQPSLGWTAACFPIQIGEPASTQGGLAAR